MDDDDGSGEQVDVVDDDDVVIGRTSRRRMRAERLRHRAVFIVVRSTAGEVLVHQRSPHKDLWPGRWDLCVGGVVAAGEDYDAAAARELAEELGVTGVALTPVGGGAYADDDVALVGRVYHVVHDGPFTFTDDEVVQARFVPMSELARLVATEAFVPDSPALVLPLD